MSEIAIRSRRAAFNAAIAKRDASAIGPFLAKDCVMVTGSDSSIISGRVGQVKVWRSLFKSGEEAVYVRTPDSVALSQAEPVAMEQGHWQGICASGAVLNHGSYCAKWRAISGDWVIVAEIFVTLG